MCDQQSSEDVCVNYAHTSAVAYSVAQLEVDADDQTGRGDPDHGELSFLDPV